MTHVVNCDPGIMSTSRTMTIREFVDVLAPNHGRTSCSDEESNGNEYFNEMGFPRCVRCALLHYVQNGEWPHGASVSEISIRFAVD